MKTGLILIDVESYMSSVSLVEAGRLKEYYVEDKDASYITGNIYKGKVVNMLTDCSPLLSISAAQETAFFRWRRPWGISLFLTTRE